MNYLKAFIAGIALPSTILPIILCIAVAYGKPQVLDVQFVHVIPLLWGIWNVLYFAFLKNVIPGEHQLRLFLTGGILGLLIACYGVFWLNVPAILGLPESVHYLPLIGAPILYAILWRYVVHPLNNLLGVGSD